MSSSQGGPNEIVERLLKPGAQLEQHHRSARGTFPLGEARDGARGDLQRRKLRVVDAVVAGRVLACVMGQWWRAVVGLGLRLRVGLVARATYGPEAPSGQSLEGSA